MGRVSEIVKHLIIINVIFFIASIVFGELMYDLFAMHYPNNSDFILWQPVTHMFMHGDITHILFNMFGLWMFGTPLEQMWGKQKFVFFYLSAGFGAVLIQTIVYHYDVMSVTQILIDNGLTNSDVDAFYKTGRLNTSIIQSVGEDRLYSGIQSFKAVMVGASGALYGILVAFAMLFPNVQLMLLFPPIPIKAKFFVPLLILFDLFFGFTSYSVGPIAHFAHIGGAVTGFLMMWYWKKNQFNNRRWN
ncbi:MAG: rhomboid family intramembrane serine protease [Candidatus Marisimplicoccus sp.]|jgi:membrane associated rhomboid family serine protease|nr:rhomboid family intramembrane serine protease [Flavobacteriaceae bacterium]MBT4324308.1 rhomboid family intramembrane serine protease [Cryomorphaceae bacterium]MDB0024828.1 rhomboid family intramembrane serine protease [bacterium]RZP00556.1 MAG: rhomboid family intramembrane serine protease [Flavobacteriales bacterium]MBT7739188.1 rhomboid family intramembrane serine protease [Cryomorphaceae bacterium]|tara:strand:+ start:665 stop:1402 length:738 start_codon:yes stop_codon:yes gene_type:complete